MGTKERREKHKEGLRQLILDAAIELFVTEGYESTTMRKIAEKIDYSPPTIYFYFRDKAELFDNICAETFGKLDQQMELLRAEVAAEKSEPLVNLEKALRGYIDFGLRHPNHYTVTFILTSEFEANGGESRKKTTGLKTFGCMRQMVAEYLISKNGTDVGVEETSQALWAAIHGVTSLLITQKGFPFVEQKMLINKLVEILIKGVRN